MANRWGKIGNSDRFIFLCCKFTADGDCSHEIKRHLLLGKNAMTNLDSMLKSRDITLLTKVCIVNSLVFPVVMYGYESWTIEKSECQRIDAFELCCWRRLLRIPWTARKLKQLILKEINPEYSLERGFSCGSDSKELACSAGDLGLIPELERSPGGQHGHPLQYSCLENPHGQRSLVGYSLWGRKELDMSERLSTAQHSIHWKNWRLSWNSNT